MPLAEWIRDASDSQYWDSVKFNRWEVVVTDLVFEPDEHGTEQRKAKPGLAAPD